jgi:ribosomal protein S12 methylthiotransferase accessory factor
MKALGEALERYSAGVYREREFTTAPASDLEGAVAPAEFVLPEGIDPNPEEPLLWVAGEDLRSGERAHLPAEFVQFPPSERTYRPSITTGLGLGSSETAALLSGLYEAIERDAAMLAWYSTFEPLGLAVSDAEYRELARRARGEGLSVTPLLLTQDVDVPVVAVAVHREAGGDGDDGVVEGGGVGGRGGDESGSDGWPRFAVGSSANLDAATAARSALAEALQGWTELRAMGPDGATDAEGAIGRYAGFPASTRAFVEPAGRVPAASVGEEVPGAAAELDTLLGRVADAGLDAYAARLTTRDVERLGFEAVRVLVPEAQPLFTGDAFFGERARTVPEELGFEPRLDREHHPYP